MGVLDFLKKKILEPKKQPEEYYKVILTERFVAVEHPKLEKTQIDWDEISEIKIITTDEGPWLPDFWIGLFGNGKKCLIPQGANGYDEVYNRVSSNKGFNFENVLKAISSTDNNSFLVWTKGLTE